MRAAAFLLILAGCSSADQPRAFTADDRQQLADANEMLDADSVSTEAIANESPAP